MASNASSAEQSIDRRKLLKGLAAVPLSALAGCQDDDSTTTTESGETDTDGNGGNQELGERVPTLTYEYLGGQAGRTAIMEEMAPLVAEDLQKIGIELEVRGKPVAQSIGEIIEDARNTHILCAISTSSPDRLDPQEWMLRFSINNAGAGGLNLANWANCDFSGPAIGQANSGPEKRNQLVTEALNIAADDYAMIATFGDQDFQVVHTNNVEVNNAGGSGMRPINPMAMINSRPKNGDAIRISANAEGLNRKNWTVIQQGPTFFIWNALIYSPLMMYDENFNVVNSLITGYDVNEDATQYTVNIAEDATFHNGDPITGEHVKFTFEFLNNNRSAVYKAAEIPIDEINIVDDKTVEFNFTSSYPIFETRDMTTFGIMHKGQWEEADGRSGEFQIPDDVWGSGPFQLASFNADQSMRLTPHDGHPNFEPDHDLVFSAFRDQSSAQQSYNANEIDVLTLISPSGFDQMTGQGDNEGYSSLGVVPGPGIYPQFPMTPCKFKPFRNAMGKAINRERINQIVLFGQGKPQMHPIWFMTEHPWFPNNIDGTPDISTTYTDDPTGDVDAAKQVLEEAGWGWDDDGRLHYPADADTSALWPAEGNPTPENFPCVNDEGNYAENN